MAKIGVYLDTRVSNRNGKYPLKLVIRHNNTTAMCPLNIAINKEDWNDKLGLVVGGKMMKQINSLISRSVAEYEDKIVTLRNRGKLRNMSAVQIRDYKDTENQTETPLQTFERINKDIKATTMKHRLAIINSVRGFCDLDNLQYDDITPDWVASYIEYLKSKNFAISSINGYMFVLKRLFREARKIMPYLHNPFIDIKTKRRVIRKRNLSVYQVREIVNAQLKGNKAYHRDMFLLSLFLVGMNNVDMYKIEEIRHGRIEYVRSKLEHHGYTMSIKVEQEAMRIINRYKGKKRLLDISDKYTSVGCFNSASARNLKSLFPFLSSYWARHTWASIASELGVPIDTIALALGHAHEHTMTMIYVNYDSAKIDEANRRVIDYILYDKK